MSVLRVTQDGRTAADLTSLVECDEVIQSLQVTVDELQAIPPQHRTRPQRQALRFRQLGVERVRERRADLKREELDSRLVAVLERLEPGLVAYARTLTPEPAHMPTR